MFQNYEFVSYQTDNTNLFTRESSLYLKPTVATSKAQVNGRLDLTQGYVITNCEPELCLVGTLM